MMSKLGKRLKELRMEKKLSQAEAAKRLRINQSTVSNYENGRKRPDMNTLVKLGVFYGVSPDDLIWHMISDEDTYQKSNNPEGAVQEQFVVYDQTPNPSITKEDLKNRFNLVVDDRPATEEEIEEAIRYIQFQRELRKKD